MKQIEKGFKHDNRWREHIFSFLGILAKEINADFPVDKKVNLSENGYVQDMQLYDRIKSPNYKEQLYLEDLFILTQSMSKLVINLEQNPATNGRSNIFEVTTKPERIIDLDVYNYRDEVNEISSISSENTGNSEICDVEQKLDIPEPVPDNADVQVRNTNTLYSSASLDYEEVEDAGMYDTFQLSNPDLNRNSPLAAEHQVKFSVDPQEHAISEKIAPSADVALVLTTDEKPLSNPDVGSQLNDLLPNNVEVVEDIQHAMFKTTAIPHLPIEAKQPSNPDKDSQFDDLLPSNTLLGCSTDTQYVIVKEKTAAIDSHASLLSIDLKQFSIADNSNLEEESRNYIEMVGCQSEIPSEPFESSQVSDLENADDADQQNIK